MKKYRKYTTQKKLEFLRQWRGSNLSKEQYCKQAGISKNSLYNWIKKYEDDLIYKSDNSFISVEVSGSKKSYDVKPVVIDIFYPNGIRINCPLSVSKLQLQKLLYL